ncbi:hypothetical protein [Undibacterium sp. WLHG33]|uniref:hypothetical protein n=1 Tax=Undibacterium sp. WLHG33 TaxID=3412482 RepID=UPI003C2EF5D6
MKKLNLLAIVASIALLGGCQNMMKTMVAHIRIDSTQTAFIAKGNAYANFCLSKNMLNRQAAYEFSTIAAEMLDLVVFDNDFYKTTYENGVSGLNENYQKDPSGAAPACQELERNLPTVIANLSNVYRKYAQELGVARSEENQRLAQQMSNFRLPNTPIPQMSFPNVRYSQEQSKTQNFLVNSNSGLTQCRVTSNNFVFCL